MSQRILFLGQALEKEDFDKVFEEWYEEKMLGFKRAVNKFLKKHFRDYTDEERKHLKKNDPKYVNLTNTAQVLADWNYIESTYLGNDPVELMVTWRNSKDLNSEIIFSTRLNMETMSTDRKNITLSLKQALALYEETKHVKAMQEIQDVLNEHYKNMISSLKTLLSLEEAHRFHQFLGPQGKNSKANNLHYSYAHGNPEGYLRFFSEGQEQSQGVLMDCFLNHIAGHHHQILDIMTTTSDSSTVSDIVLAQAINSLKTGFRSEFESEDEFYEWMYRGTNKTPWYKGGDMVIFDTNGKIVLNIQAKNNFKNSAAELSFDSFVTELRGLTDYKVSEKDKIREKMWKIFSMEIEHGAVPAKIDNKIEQTAEKLIEDGLSGIIKK